MKSIKRLQVTQNAAARLIRQTKKRAHMTPVLQDLHWLPVVNRCQFKILNITFYLQISQERSSELHI